MEVLTWWVNNAVLGQIFVPLNLKNEGENDFLAYGKNWRCFCVLGWVENPNIHRMINLPELDGEKVVRKGRVE